MPLDPVRPAYHQHRAVQHLEAPLHLRREIHVPRGVQKGHRLISQPEHRLLGEDGDPPVLLQLFRIQEGVFVIHPAQLPDPALQIKDGLRKGGLARIHVGQNAHAYMF